MQYVSFLNNRNACLDLNHWIHYWIVGTTKKLKKKHPELNVKLLTQSKTHFSIIICPVPWVTMTTNSKIKHFALNNTKLNNIHNWNPIKHFSPFFLFENGIFRSFRKGPTRYIMQWKQKTKQNKWDKSMNVC